ncbi:hypothetical protein QJS10_CPA10g01964 [Acorus calamus]|uniref:Secreted protein n=1 Tax=Acorus calamus TaxID=4465 RepID=A0AAV9E0V6_ACOCL|nr:hypothetical protein QJS10_CPA10g01964 [Acorus calamus]
MAVFVFFLLFLALVDSSAISRRKAKLRVAVTSLELPLCLPQIQYCRNHPNLNQLTRHHNHTKHKLTLWWNINNQWRSAWNNSRTWSLRDQHWP